MIGRVLRTGLSSLRDRAAARLAALRFNPSRMAGFIILALLASGYGVLLIAYTIETCILHPQHGWANLIGFAIQLALVWAFACLCLLAKAVRPY